MRTAIIERNLFGGACISNGCVPTKTLVSSARTAHVARRGAEYGVIFDGSVSVDMTLVKARKDTGVLASRKGQTKWIETTESLTLYRGHGRLGALVASALAASCWRRNESS